MATAGTIAVNLIARTEAFTKGMSRSQRTIRSLEKATMKTMRTIRTFGALAGAAAVYGLTRLTKQSMQSIDEIAKLSDRLGVSTEFLAAFGHQAKIAGTDQATLAKSIQYMLKNIGEANMGLKSYQDAFNEIGVSYKDVESLSPEDAFLKIGTAISETESQATKMSVAMRIFGRSGSAMLNLFDGNLDNVISNAEKLGITFSRDMAARVEAANDAIARMQSSFTGIGNAIAISVSPHIQAMADYITGMSSGKNSIDTLSKQIDNLALSVISLGDAWIVVSSAVNYSRGIVLKLVSGITTAIAKIGEFSTAFGGISEEKVKQNEKWIKDLREFSEGTGEAAEEYYKKADKLINEIGKSREEFIKKLEQIRSDTKTSSKPAKIAAKLAMEEVDKKKKDKQTGSADVFSSRYIDIRGLQSGNEREERMKTNLLLQEMLTVQKKAFN